MSLIPLQDYVLLEPIHAKPKAGIILSNLADVEETNRARVVALGDKVTLPIKVKDEVLFKPHLFDSIEVGSKEAHRIGRQDGIFAKL